MSLRRAWADHGASRFEAVATILAAWIVLGVYLVDWAFQRGLIASASFSIYHLPAYLGLIALVVVVGERMFDRSAGHGPGGRIRTAWNSRSTGERVVVAGTGLILAYVIGDLLWQLIVPIDDQGLEGRQAPTRLLLAVGTAMVASGWIVAAPSGGHRVGWLGVLGFTAILAMANFWIGDWHPAFSARPAKLPADLDTLTSEVWTMAPDGRSQTRVIGEGPGEVSQPAFSPDGKQIVYVRWSGPADDLTADLWIVDADGANPRQLTNDPGWEWIPAWSPDGAWIAYTAPPTPPAGQPAAVPRPEPGLVRRDVTAEGGDWRIFAIHPDGSGRHQLAIAGDSSAPAWSPDGRQIAYLGNRDGNLDLFVADAEGNHEGRLTSDPADEWSPAWSPDGTRLAYTSNEAGNDDVWAMNADGSNPIQLTGDPAADQVPVWSPDGSRIAFVSDRTGDPEIWSMAADGSGLRNLSQSPASNDGRWSIGWSRDGSRLVYARSTDLPVRDEPLVRLDLGLAGLLLVAVVLALVALAADGVGGLPFGGLAVVLGVSALLVAALSDGWRFVPAALAAGLLGDLIGRWSPGPLRRTALAALVPATFALTDLLILVATGSLGWSTTLSLGAVLASGLLGGAIAIATNQRTSERRASG